MHVCWSDSVRWFDKTLCLSGVSIFYASRIYLIYSTIRHFNSRANITSGPWVRAKQSFLLVLNLCHNPSWEARQSSTGTPYWHTSSYASFCDCFTFISCNFWLSCVLPYNRCAVVCMSLWVSYFFWDMVATVHLFMVLVFVSWSCLIDFATRHVNSHLG